MEKPVWFWALCFFAQWRIALVWGCRSNSCFSVRSLITGIGSWPQHLGKQFVPSAWGQCWWAAVVASVGNIYSMGWSPPLGVRASNLSPMSRDCVAQTVKISLVFMGWYLQWGRKSHPHPPGLGNSGTFFQSVCSGTFGSLVFGATMFWKQPLTLSSEYKPMGTCQFFIHKLGKLKLNESVNKPGKSIWSRWSCADLCLPENLFRPECFWGYSRFLLSLSSSRTLLLIPVLIHFIWPLHPPHTRGILFVQGFLYRDI